MKEHALKMVKFASTFKALMFVCDIADSSKVTEFLESENPSTLNPIFYSRLKKLTFKDGVFCDNLRHCTCSEIQFEHEKQEIILNPTSYVGENGFCYHSPLPTDLQPLYTRLVDFCQTSLSILKGNS